MAGLSRQCLGRIKMKRGKLAEAAELFQSYYNVSVDKPWKNEDAIRCRLYTPSFFFLVDRFFYLF